MSKLKLAMRQFIRTSPVACRLYFVLILVCALSNTIVAQDLSRLEALVTRGSVEQKRNALAEIRSLRSEAASRVALTAIGDGDELVRATAINAILFLPENEIAAALVPLLSVKQEFIRREAAFALGEAHAASALPALIKTATEDRENNVRSAAVTALGGIASEAALPTLVAILKRRPSASDEYLRRAAARSMGQIAEHSRFGRRSTATPSDFLPPKFKKLVASSATPRASAAFAESLELLLKVAVDRRETDDTRREAAFALGAIGDPAASPFLRANTANTDVYLAEICREALLKITPQQ